MLTKAAPRTGYAILPCSSASRETRSLRTSRRDSYQLERLVNQRVSSASILGVRSLLASSESLESDVEEEIRWCLCEPPRVFKATVTASSVISNGRFSERHGNGGTAASSAHLLVHNLEKLCRNVEGNWRLRWGSAVMKVEVR